MNPQTPQEQLPTQQSPVAMPPPMSSPGPQPLPVAQQSLRQLAQTMPPQPAAPQPAAAPSMPQQLPPAYDNIYTEICIEIIKAQSKIIGIGLALEQAQGITGLSVDPETLHCTVLGDGSRVIDELIKRYRSFFGYAAVEVCREAAARLVTNLSPEQTPTLLNATP